MKRIGMLTSGGDCQALNAAMRGVVKSLVNSKEEVEIYGFLNGYRGLIYGDFKMLTGRDFAGILTVGGMINEPQPAPMDRDAYHSWLAHRFIYALFPRNLGR